MVIATERMRSAGRPGSVSHHHGSDGRELTAMISAIPTMNPSITGSGTSAMPGFDLASPPSGAALRDAERLGEGPGITLR
jgi:hypothetical protein